MSTLPSRPGPPIPDAIMVTTPSTATINSACDQDDYYEQDRSHPGGSSSLSVSLPPRSRRFALLSPPSDNDLSHYSQASVLEAASESPKRRSHSATTSPQLTAARRAPPSPLKSSFNRNNFQSSTPTVSSPNRSIPSSPTSPLHHWRTNSNGDRHTISSVSSFPSSRSSLPSSRGSSFPPQPVRKNSRQPESPSPSIISFDRSSTQSQQMPVLAPAPPPRPQRRKTSSASQQSFPSQPRMSVASTTSVSTFASSYAPSLPPPPRSPAGSVLSFNQYASPLDINMPALPPKSPLRRPVKKSTSSFTGLLDMYDLNESKPVPLTPVPGMSVPPQYSSPYNQMVDEPMQMNYSWDGAPQLTARAKPPERPLPRRPSMESQLSQSDMTGETMVNGNQSVTSLGSLLTTSTTATSGSSGTAMGVSTSATSAVAVPLQPDVDEATATRKANKRKHALLEMLSSERAYAADLALVKGIHIPLSKGLQPSFQLPESSSASIAPSIHSNGIHKNGGGALLLQSTSRRSSNTNSTNSSVYTAASISGASTGPTSSSAQSINGSISSCQYTDLPMNPEASKTIFGNIEELATFADAFSDRLELALGNVIEGGSGEDQVGELFLEMVPQMGPLYKTYITRHPTALAQFQSLPPCPALTNYVSLTKQLAASHTNAWDIPSLLIKPVQRLLKYPLLLGAIHNETADDHPDKPKLQEAKDRIEEVARNVNEGRRRWEVVKGILTQGDASNTGSLNSKESGLIPGRGAAPPKMGRMRSFRSKIKPSLLEGPDRDKNAKEEMEMWETKIKDCELALKDLARDSLQWSREVRISFAALRGWNSQFGSVVGLGESGIEAVGAFGKVVGGLLTLWLDLDHTLQNILLPQLQKLVRTLSSPQILLAHMHTLHHSHVTLLNTPYNKSRPPNALIEASNDYLALQATLREELPSFFTLFEKGLTWILVEFSRWQARFWREVREHWLTFWIALAVEGEDQANGQINGIGSGAAETMRIWWERFEEVEQIVQGFRITNRPPRVRKASGQPANGLYQHTNGSGASVQDSRSIRDAYLGMTQTLSAHALPAAPSPEHYERDVFSSDRNKERQSTHSLPTPSVKTTHKRRGSSAADSTRTTEVGVIALDSMMPAAPVPAKSSSGRRSKSGDRERQKEKEKEKAFDREKALRKEVERENELIRKRERELETLEMQRAMERMVMQPKKAMAPPPPPPPPPLPRRRSSKSNDRSRPVTPGTVKPVDQPAPRIKTPSRTLSPPPSHAPLISPVSPSSRDRRRDVPKEIDDDNMSVKSSTRSLRRFAGDLFNSRSRPRSHSRSNSSPPPTVPSLPTPTMPSLKSRPSAPAQLQIGEPRPAPRPPIGPHHRSMSTDNCAHSRGSIHRDFLPHMEFEEPFAANAPFPSQLDPPPSPLYSCTTIVPFLPPHNIMYMSLPFIQLHVGDTIQVLVEAGHPSDHALPIFVDDGDDCLLVARDEAGRIGWTLASFVMPLA